MSHSPKDKSSESVVCIGMILSNPTRTSFARVLHFKQDSLPGSHQSESINVDAFAVLIKPHCFVTLLSVVLICAPARLLAANL